MYKLSILIPSNRPDKLDRFVESLSDNAYDFNQIQLVILVDDDKKSIERIGNLVIIHHVPESPLCMGKLNELCYLQADAEWIMLGNDDLFCKTMYWDEKIIDRLSTAGKYDLFWINDELFCDRLSCFPIFNKQLAATINLFPCEYRRYKIDDTLFEVVPASHRFYLNEIVMAHEDKGTYHETVDQVAANFDVNLWILKERERTAQSIAIYDKLIDPNVRVLIGISTGEIARRADFYDHMDMLSLPANTMKITMHGQSPAKARNLIIEQALEHGFSHVLLVDDDMVFKPNFLKQLLSHNLDAVCGLYYSRNYPHYPLVFDYFKDNQAHFYYLQSFDKGLIPIVAAGLGAVLFKTDVFSKLEKPWVRLGELAADEWCDDIGFYLRMHRTGVKLFCDLDAYVGHQGCMTIWPDKANGHWMTSYHTNGSSVVSFPAAAPLVTEPVKELVEA